MASSASQLAEARALCIQGRKELKDSHSQQGYLYWANSIMLSASNLRIGGILVV